MNRTRWILVGLILMYDFTDSVAGPGSTSVRWVCKIAFLLLFIGAFVSAGKMIPEMGVEMRVGDLTERHLGRTITIETKPYFGALQKVGKPDEYHRTIEIVEDQYGEQRVVPWTLHRDITCWVMPPRRRRRLGLGGYASPEEPVGKLPKVSSGPAPGSSRPIGGKRG